MSELTIPGFVPNATLMASLGGCRMLAFSGDPGLARLEFIARPEFCHTNGTIVQGGFVTAWMDASMAFAVAARTSGELTFASLDISVKFLEPVGPGAVHAEGRVLRWGRRILFLESRLFSPQGKLLALATSSAMPVPYLG
jgi:uncharacterized protein (TIGR00369 family)